MNAEAIIASARESCAQAECANYIDSGHKNAENIAVLISLLDGAKIVAQAIYDNAMDDGMPINSKLATQLQIQSWNIARVIIESSRVREVMPHV